MINLYRFILNFLKLFINFLFIVQITLIILIFLTAAYWFFSLIESSVFNFVEPIATYISDFVKLFYNHDIVAGGVYIDGSLLLFDILALILIFIISKFKNTIFLMQDFCSRKIIQCKRSIEKQFNLQLKRDADDAIKKYNNAAFLISFDIKDYSAENLWGGSPDKSIDETKLYLIDSLCSILNKITFISYKKGNMKVVIYLKDFDKVDSVLNLIHKFIKDNKEILLKKRWILDYYCAVAAYSNGKSVELDVLPKLEYLIKLKQKNEILCFGDFSLRYSLQERKMFYGTNLKGAYSLDGKSNIYYLVKKD